MLIGLGTQTGRRVSPEQHIFESEKHLELTLTEVGEPLRCRNALVLLV